MLGVCQGDLTPGAEKRQAPESVAERKERVMYPSLSIIDTAFARSHELLTEAAPKHGRMVEPSRARRHRRLSLASAGLRSTLCAATSYREEPAMFTQFTRWFAFAMLFSLL